MKHGDLVIVMLVVLLSACGRPESIPAPVEPVIVTKPVLQTPVQSINTAIPTPTRKVPTANIATLIPTESAGNKEPLPTMKANSDPWSSQAGDDQWTRAAAFIEKKDLLVLESFPPQYVLQLSGSLPTPCHKLRVNISKPDSDNKIQVDVYSLVEPGKVCIQVLEPFEARIRLENQSAGVYSLIVNSEKLGELQY